MLKIYLTSTDGSGNESRKALHSVSNRDEALADCWALAQANEKVVKSNGWDTNLMISSQFDWCAALQQIDRGTGRQSSTTGGHTKTTLACTPTTPCMR